VMLATRDKPYLTDRERHARANSRAVGVTAGAATGLGGAWLVGASGAVSGLGRLGSRRGLPRSDRWSAGGMVAGVVSRAARRRTSSGRGDPRIDRLPTDPCVRADATRDPGRIGSPVTRPVASDSAHVASCGTHSVQLLWDRPKTHWRCHTRPRSIRHMRLQASRRRQRDGRGTASSVTSDNPAQTR
jgi:hypothetical protein